MFYLCFACTFSGGSLSHIRTFDDIERFREECGAAGVMIARTALYNPSIFRRDGILPIENVIVEYLKKASFHLHKFSLILLLHNVLFNM